MVTRSLSFIADFSGVNKRPIDEVNKAMDETVKKAGDSGKGFKGMADNLDKMGKKAQSAGKTLMKGVTAPLVGVGTAAIATVSTFDDSMSQVGAIAGDLSDNEFTQLRDMAKDLGAITAHSASTAADSMSTLAAAGYDFNQIQAATPEVLSLASAGMLELDQAAGILTGTLAMFSMDATEENFQRVADVTAKAASSAKTSVEEIGSAMDMAGGAAGNMGMDIEQTNAVLGVFANQNIVGSRAGTVFTAMQSDLASATEDGKIAIADQAVAVYDSEGAWRDMGSIMADIESATKDMTGAQKDKILMDTFGIQSMKGVNAMLTEGSEGYKSLEEAMYDSNGAAAQMAEDMEDNIGGAFRSMKSATEGLLIEIGDVLKGPVQDVADFTGELAGKFGQLDTPTKELIVKLGAVAAAIGPVLFVGGKLLTGVKLVGAAIAFIASPVGLAIGATVALGGALYALWNTNEEFRENVTGIWQGLQTAIGGVVSYINTIWEAHGATLMSVASGAWELISGVITGAMGVIQGAISVALGVIQGDWSRVWSGIQTMFEGVMTAVGAAWNTAKGIIGTVIKGTIDAVTDKFHSAVDKAKEAWESLRTFMKNPIKGTVNAVQKGAGWVKDKVSGSHASGAYSIPYDGYEIA